MDAAFAIATVLLYALRPVPTAWCPDCPTMGLDPYWHRFPKEEVTTRKVAVARSVIGLFNENRYKHSHGGREYH